MFLSKSALAEIMVHHQIGNIQIWIDISLVYMMKTINISQNFKSDLSETDVASISQVHMFFMIISAFWERSIEYCSNNQIHSLIHPKE